MRTSSSIHVAGSAVAARWLTDLRMRITKLPHSDPTDEAPPNRRHHRSALRLVGRNGDPSFGPA